MRQDWAQFKIETVKPSTVDECLRLFDSNCPKYFLPEEKADFQGFLDKFMNNYLIVRDQSGRVVACGGIIANSDVEASLCWGMVDEKLHKARIGEMFLASRLLIAAEMKEWTSVVCQTTQLTEGFFAKYGFITEKSVDDHWGPGLHLRQMRFKLDDLNRKQIKSWFMS